MIDKSLFICYSTPNYSELTEIFLKSLESIGAKHISHKLDNPPKFEGTGFRTDLWYYCVRNKINHLIDTLTNHMGSKEYDYFIFTDCDIVYIAHNKSEWANLESYVLSQPTNICFMRENTREREVNTGFFIMKNNEGIREILDFFAEVLHIMDTSKKNDMPFGDQSIINNIKHKIAHSYMPVEYVVFGTVIYNKDKCLMHHAVCCNDVDEKIAQVNTIKSTLEEYYVSK